MDTAAEASDDEGCDGFWVWNREHNRNNCSALRRAPLLVAGSLLLHFRLVAVQLSLHGSQLGVLLLPSRRRRLASAAVLRDARVTICGDAIDPSLSSAANMQQA